MKLTTITKEEYAQVEAHVIGKLHTENTNEKFDPLMYAYKVWLEYKEGDDTGKLSPDDEFTVDYQVAKEIIRTLRPNYSQDTLTHFCIDLLPFTESYFFEDTGLFLSAYINLSHQKTKLKDYILDVSIFNVPLSYIGTNNESNITIFGNVKHYLGKSMDNGKIILNGDCESLTGADMYNGEIIINGNASSDVGNVLRGGTIRVKGNAGIDVGSGMCLGTIYLDGTYTNLADDKARGEIYHKDTIIWRQY